MDKKVIILTGANGGIGKAITTVLLCNDYHVIALDINDNNLKDVDAEFYKCNLANKEEILEVFNKVKEKYSSVFAIINCIGIFMMESLIEGSDEDFKKIIDINFYSVYQTNKIFFPLLNKGSKIINLSSEVVRLSPQPFEGYYSLSKIFLDAYSDVLRREAVYLGIKVIKIRSGNMKTPLVAGVSKEFDEMVNNSTHFKSQLAKLKYMMDRELEHGNNPSIIANKMIRILKKKRPKIAYNIKNSFYLKLIGLMPEKVQDWIYKRVIK